MHTIKRYHDICTGHRVHGHEGKCQHLHGHNYRIHFTCTADKLDNLGRVVDFGVVKEKLCMWIEEQWDHKFLAWNQDDFMKGICDLVSIESANVGEFEARNMLIDSIIWVPFNPTAENMAEHLVEKIGPLVLEYTGVTLIEVTIEETAKCSATYTKEIKNA